MDLDQGFKWLILGYQDPQILGLIPSKISSQNLFLKIGLLDQRGWDICSERYRRG